MQEPFPESVVILGAAGGGRLAYWILQETYPGTRVVFVDDGMEQNFLVLDGAEYPILHEWNFESLQKAGTEDFRYFMVSCTYPRVKKALVTKALAAGLSPAPSVIHPQASLVGRPTITVGRGGSIHPKAVILNDTVIGDYTFISAGAQIGHDCIIGDFASINFGSLVLGYTHIKEGVATGSGSTVRDHLVIAPWVQTGMQCCVAKSITEEGITVAGVPARPMVKRTPSG